MNQGPALRPDETYNLTVMKPTHPNSGFWGTLKRPIYAMAPMADVTDAAFRRLVARYGKPDIFFTEFVSCDGLCSRGYPHLLQHLYYDESERPVVAQLFGDNPDTFREAASICRDLGFDGVDINMGCPVKTVIKTGSGAALIRNPGLALEIIAATMEGASPLPVSVKTRIGFNRIVAEEWLSHLLESQPAAITFHLRTQEEMSKVEAHWDVMGRIVEQAAGSPTLILGNGDIRDLDHADELIAQTGMDGAMLGRAIYGNLWLFDRNRSRDEIGLDERLAVMIEHAFLFESTFAGEKNFAVMRKHLLAHASGFPGSKELRLRLQEVNGAMDVVGAAEWFKSSYGLTGPVGTSVARQDPVRRQSA